MTERDVQEIRDLLSRVMTDAPEPVAWSDVARRAVSLDSSSNTDGRTGIASVTMPADLSEHRVASPDGANEPDRGGRRLVVLAFGVAAAVVVVIGGWLWSGAQDTGEPVPVDQPVDSSPSPTTAAIEPPAFPSSRPAAPYDPSFTDLSIPVLGQRDGVLGLLGSRGEFVPMDEEYRPPVPLGDQRILDTAGIGGGSYVILCCDPGPTLWRNGQRSPYSATRVQFVSDFRGRSLYLAVDDVEDELRLDRDTFDSPNPAGVPGVIDAAVDLDRVVALVAGADPHLLAYDLPIASPSLGRIEPRRIEVPLADQGPCSIGLVSEGLLVLYGTSDGADRCVGDRAALVDGATGELIRTMRLPGESRQMNASWDHVVIVTTDGRAIVGRFDSPTGGAPQSTDEPRWATIVQEGALGASLGFG